MTDSLREVVARALWRSNDVDELGDWELWLDDADAALAAIEARGTYIPALEYEALARAARAYLEHPDLASAAATLQGMVQRAERLLAARPRDAGEG